MECGLANLDNVSKLTGLTELYLSGNSLKNLVGIEKITELTKLNVSDNQITSCEPLKNLTSLTYLDLQNNALDGQSKYGDDKQGNLDILANLHTSKNGSLTKLYLKGNIDLTNFISNHEILTLEWANNKDAADTNIW
jgi:Leucine-rich repeat (LRR) protein